MAKIVNINSKISQKHITRTIDWRIDFSPQQLKTAQNHISNGNYHEFQCNEAMATAYIGKSINSSYHPRIIYPPSSVYDEWDTDNYSCNCKTANPKYNWYGAEEKKVCTHEAALLMLWEQEHGPWTFTESDEEYEERLKKEAIEAEKQRLRDQKKEQEQEGHIASDWKLPAPKSSEAIFFDIPTALRRTKTNLYALNRGKEILESGDIRLEGNPVLTYSSEGNQILRCFSKIDSEVDRSEATIVLGQNSIEDHRCSCRRSSRSYYGFYYEGMAELCPHELATLSLVWDYVNEKNPGDATDRDADKFFSYLDGDASFDAEESAEEYEKKP